MIKARLFFHIVWTTRNRQPQIRPVVEARLFRVLAATCHRLKARVFAISAMPDHLHMVAALPPTISIDTFVSRMKHSAARFVHRAYQLPLEWQIGYGVHSLGREDMPEVIRYVREQKERHRTGLVLNPLESTSDADEGPDMPFSLN